MSRGATPSADALPADEPLRGASPASVVEKLSHVRLGMDEPDAVERFLADTIGLQRVASADGVRRFRSDYRDHTVAVHDDSGVPPSLALEVRDTGVLDTLAARCETFGLEPIPLDEAACSVRRVRAGLSLDVRGGYAVELVVRPLHSGWRYHGTRDAGIVEFFGAAFGSTDVATDTRLWTELLGGRVSDYVGDAAYIALDDEHHRIALHPSERDRMLEIQFRVEGLHELMQNSYFLQSLQVPIVHGPGRRPTSEQAFLSVRGPEGLLVGLVAEGRTIDRDAEHLPRQFARHPDSFCSWGSVSDLPEFR